MLTVRIHNTGEGSNESASYEYWVFVNNREIERGEISGHNRNDGWAALVKSIAERHLTPLALDGGDSAAFQALSTPEVLSTLQGESTPAHRK